MVPASACACVVESVDGICEMCMSCSLLFLLDEAQGADTSSMSEEQQSDPNPSTKDDPNHAADRTEESGFNKDFATLPPPPDSVSESETGLPDASVEKGQEPEE